MSITNGGWNEVRFKCGCLVGKAGQRIEIVYCSKHKAALDMYGALKSWKKAFFAHSSKSKKEFKEILDDCWAKTAQALAEAEGEVRMTTGKPLYEEDGDRAADREWEKDGTPLNQGGEMRKITKDDFVIVTTPCGATLRWKHNRAVAQMFRGLDSQKRARGFVKFLVKWYDSHDYYLKGEKNGKKVVGPA